jgi:Uncharacterized protein conserved in bacteria (DUF2179)
METPFFDSDFFSYILLPLMIFFARICDVLIGTNGFGATVVEAHGAREQVHLIYTIVQRNELSNVLNLINRFNPRAFYTIEDMKAANEGIFMPKNFYSALPFSNVLRQWRKGK